MAVTRRIGAESAANRSALMDAVEAVMREEGYAALSARSVAKRGGLKHQLVFYYFESMDELLLATYRRHINRYREVMKHALSSPRPLHSFWEVNGNVHDAVLHFEFMAMANHNEAVRIETARFGEEFRSFIRRDPEPTPTQLGATYSQAAAMMVINYIGNILGLESAIGISGLHTEIRTLVDRCVDLLEPGTVQD